MTDTSTASKELVLNSTGIDRIVSRICYEILDKEGFMAGMERPPLAIVGIKTGGEFLARRIVNRLKEISDEEVNLGVVDITLYRDDISTRDAYPLLKGTDLPFRISGSRIVLVDDVLFTGRTIRAALDAIIDFGRPKAVELCCLIDRGHRELPIRPDYVGRTLHTNYVDSVKLKLKEMGSEDDRVILIRR